MQRPREGPSKFDGVGAGRHTFSLDARVEDRRIIGTLRARHGEAIEPESL